MKVLIADKFERSGIEGLEALGHEVVVDPGLGPETLSNAVAGIDLLIVRSTKVPGDVIASADALKGIIRAGAGYDNIDCAAASQAGVAVCNCPGMNAVAVAELAMGHLINCDRRLGEQTAALRSGTWDKKGFGKARGLKGMRLGILGFGAIGSELGTRAKAFGMDLAVWTLHDHAQEFARLGATYYGNDRAGLIRLASACDAISVHLPGGAETKGMLDAEFFTAMKDGAYFVNTARGSVVDEAALIRAVGEKGLRVGLDVYANQPGESQASWTTPTAELAHASLTHHCGASTDQAQQAVADEVVRIVRVFAESGRWENQVNTSPALA